MHRSIDTPPPRRRRGSLLAIAAAVTILAGALAAVVLADGGATGASTTASSTTPAGQRPPPLIFRPAALSRAKPVPLVLAFHGSGGNAAGMEGQTRLEAVATEHGFVLAYPDSATDPPWQASDDISYVSSLIDQLVSSQNIDRSRIYITGFSAGARMAYFVACMLSTRVAAVAAVSSVMRGYTCRLAHPLSELTITGTTGSDALLVSGRAGGFPSSAQVAATWRSLNGCAAGATPASAQVGPVAQQQWSGCTDGSAVALYTVQGGSHFWPGQYGASGVDAQYNASEGIWAFFAAHPGTPLTPSASLRSLTVSRGGARQIVAELQTGEPLAVSATVSLGARRVLSRRVTLKAAGRASVKLALPRSARKGKASVRLAIRDAYGRTTTTARSVRLS